MTKTNYIISEYPIFFSPTLAKVYGVNEAIILQKIHIFLENENSGVEYRKHKWIYNSYAEWLKMMPFLTKDIIAKALRGLENRGVLKSCQPFKNRWDRRKAYRILYEKIDIDCAK